jgi:hypothetical protein
LVGAVSRQSSRWIPTSDAASRKATSKENAPVAVAANRGVNSLLDKEIEMNMESYTNTEVVTIQKPSHERQRRKCIKNNKPHRPDVPVQLELPFDWSTTEGGLHHD